MIWGLAFSVIGHKINNFSYVLLLSCFPFLKQKKSLCLVSFPYICIMMILFVTNNHLQFWGKYIVLIQGFGY